MERLSGKPLAIRKARVIAAVTSFQRRHAPTRSGHQIQLGLMRDALLDVFLLIEAMTAAAFPRRQFGRVLHEHHVPSPSP